MAQLVSYFKGGSKLGKREEQFRKDTVGRLLAVCQQSVDSLPTVGRLLANCRPTVFVMFQAKVLADCQPTVGRQSATCWQSVGGS